MSKRYIIREHKPVIYTYLVYANSKAEALRKFNETQDYQEIGLDPGSGRVTVTVSAGEAASEKCMVCGLEFSPEKINCYRCKKCR